MHLNHSRKTSSRSSTAARRALTRRDLDSNLCIDLGSNGSLVLKNKEPVHNPSTSSKIHGSNSLLEDSEIFYISPEEMH